MDYQKILSEIPVDEIVEYCRASLNSYQKKKNSGRKEKLNPEKYYLFGINGELILPFKSVYEIADYLKAPFQTVLSSFKRKNILYGIYWVTKSDVFDCEKEYYNSSKVKTII